MIIFWSRRFLILCLFILAAKLPSFSQGEVRLSVKLAPAVTLNRFTSETDSLTIENHRDDVRGNFGLIVDIGFTDSYYFSTGLLYSIRKVSFYAISEPSGVSDSEQYQLEYIELPLTVKLFTNNLGVDSKIYFQTGFTVDFLVNWKGINKNDNRVDSFNSIDASFYVGAGYDKQLGVSTAFFEGIFFQRGLVDIANDNPEVTLKNDLLGLDLGLRF